MRAFIAIVFVVAISVAHVFDGLNVDNLQISLGGELVSENQGYALWRYPDEEYLLIKTFPTWYSAKDGVPLYQIKDGVCTPVEEFCP